jgi:prepilin-type N-terminal cleavage/methylation domain-containing protein
MAMQRLDFQQNKSRQRGLSLPEVLVALFIFTIVFLAALALYDRAMKAYKQADVGTIQQQNARFAMDRMSETIRDAGANYNVRGKSNVPDEQIEGAWQSAIIVRGDFDNSRETALEDAAGNFPIVTTGNDEIVAYVLTKPGSITSSGANTVQINLIADVASGSGKRDAVYTGSTPITGEETKSLYVAATTLAQQTNPPYQLRRVTFSGASGAPVDEVVAENIFRLAFTYADANGNNVITSSNAGSTDAQRATRATIRSIGIDLVTMAEAREMTYTDTVNWAGVPAAPTGSGFAAAPAGTMNVTVPNNPTAPATQFRKIRLSEEILAVNLGLKGYRHAVVPGITIQPSPQITVCIGHHLTYYVTWQPSPTSGVDYLVRARALSGPTYDNIEPVIGTTWVFKDPDSLERAFAFSVAATSSGMESTYTDEVTITSDHDTAQSIPAPPTNVAGPATGTSQMQLTWDPTTGSQTGFALNTSGQCISAGTTPGASTPTAPWNTMAPDVKEYHVFRSGTWNGNAAFTPTDPGNRVDNVTLGTMTNTTPEDANFTDNTAAPCAPYYYRVKTYDTDNVVATGDGSAAMGSGAYYIPVAGLTPTKPNAPVPVGSVSYSGGNWSVQLQWTHVLMDSGGTVGKTALYKLERQREQPSGSGNWVADGAIVDQFDKTQMAAPDVLPGVVSGQNVQYRYRIIATYPCAQWGDSNRDNASDWYYVVCTPPANHSFAIVTPAAGEVVSLPSETGFTPSLSVQPSSGSQWTSATVTITGPFPSTAVVYQSTDNSVPFNGFAYFDAVTLGLDDPQDLGVYTLTAYATANGCESQPITRTFTIEKIVCGLHIVESPAPTLQPTTGANGNRRKSLRFQVANDCGTSIVIRAIKPTWSGGTNFSLTRLNKIVYNGSDNTVSLTSSSGASVTLLSPITISGGATSFNIDLTYSHQMMGTTWTSMIFTTGTSPNLVDDEVLVNNVAPTN